jgi:hypothetical protein
LVEAGNGKHASLVISMCMLSSLIKKMVNFVSLLVTCLSVAIGEIHYATGYTLGDTKIARDGDNKNGKTVHIDGAAAELRMGINEFGLKSYSKQVEEAELYDIGQGDRFEFFICLEPKIDGIQECDEPENLDQFLLAVLRAGFMDLDVLFEGIKEVSKGEGNKRELGSHGSYNYGGYGCRRCKKARRKLNQYDGYENEYEDSISDDAIAAKMNGALRIAIIDTLALDPKSCLFYMINELLHVDIEFGK